jgi:chemotaxis protein MotB
MATPEYVEEIEEKEDWLVTYADAITLLMAFMVMLLTFAEYDMPAFETTANAIKNNLTGQESTSPTQLLRIDVQDVVFNMQADQVVKVETDKKGIVIELSSSAFFIPGTANVREEALPVIGKMTQTLLAPRYLFYTIEIEGHTDDIPISTERYPSNWELSASRAAGIIRLLIDQEIDAARMKATGYADTKPKAPNRDPEGAGIPENMAANRRVTIRVYPMSLDEKATYGAILDKREQKELEQEAIAEQGKPVEGLPKLKMQ